MNSENNYIVPMSDVNNMSGAALQILQNQIVSQQMIRYQNELESIKSEMQKSNTSLKAEIDEVKENAKAILTTAIETVRVNQPRYEFISQGEFGRCFTTSISSVRFGKMLKIIGLAQKSKSRTTPERKAIPKYAVMKAHDNFSTVEWHYVNCLNRMDKWLSKYGHMEEFYSFDNCKKLEKYIDALYKEYVLEAE